MIPKTNSSSCFYPRTLDCWNFYEQGLRYFINKIVAELGPNIVKFNTNFQRYPIKLYICILKKFFFLSRNNKSLVHWLTGSLVPWLAGSLARWLTCSEALWFFGCSLELVFFHWISESLDSGLQLSGITGSGSSSAILSGSALPGSAILVFLFAKNDISYSIELGFTVIVDVFLENRWFLPNLAIAQI